MILKSRVFGLALLLAIAAMTPGVLKAQDAQPMTEVPLGSGGSTGGKTAGGNLAGGVESIDGTAGDPTTASTTGPEAVCFDGTYVWIARQFSDSVTSVRAAGGLVSSTFTVGKRPVALLCAGGYVYSANLLSDNVTKLSASTGAEAGTY